MKHWCLILSLFALSSQAANPTYIDIENRNSLKTIYGSASDKVNDSLDDNEFFIHNKSLEYSFTSVTDGSIVKWDGPGTTLSGKVVIILTEVISDKMMCKTFTQSIVIKGTTFEGKGVACIVDNKWQVKQ